MLRRGALLAKRTEYVFPSFGFENWKKAGEKFLAHSRLQMHQEAVTKWEMSHHPTVNMMLDNATKVEQSSRKRMLVKQLELLHFLLKQGLAVRGHEE